MNQDHHDAISKGVTEYFAQRRASQLTEHYVHIPDDLSRHLADQDYKEEPSGVPSGGIEIPLKWLDGESGDFELESKDKWPAYLRGRSYSYQAFTDLIELLPQSENSATWLAKPTKAIPQGASTHFPSLTSDDFANAEPVRWLVDRVLAFLGVVLWWGAPQTGKTAMLIDLMFCVVLGLPWAGRIVEQGNVLVVCLEGQGGFRLRVLAAETHRDVKLGDRAVFVEEPMNLLVLADVIGIAKLARRHDVKLIIVDTLSASIAGTGDDSSNRDMALLISHVKLLVDWTGATVIVVHHTGRDPNATMERGASVLRGNVDTSIRTATSGDHFVWEVVKQRDGPKGVTGRFEILPHEFPAGPSGELNQSIVVRHLEVDESISSVAARRKSPLNGNQSAILAHIKMQLIALPDQCVSSEISPSIGFDEAVTQCLGLVNVKDSKHRSTRVKEALRSLILNGHLLESADRHITLPQG